MPIQQRFNQWSAQAKSSTKWLLILLPMSIAVGSACALFLWSLDKATQTRFQYPWLLFLLPMAGVAVGFLYHWFGKSAEGGNNLIMDQIHEPGGGVPRRMAPLILISTVITHLFGGSAGREGTAVQMGGSIASAIGRVFKLDASEVRILLMAGIAAGFGAVFGTPIAGAIFALEVLSIGRMHYDALIPCLFAAVVGDWTCHAWGIGHTHYPIDFLNSGAAPSQFFHLDALLLVKVIVASIAFGFAGVIFAELSHGLQSFFKKVCPYAPLRPAIGGVLVIGLVYLLGTREYLGLGVSSPNPEDVSIVTLFHGDQIHYWSWWWKILFTAITLSTGFKGGEVTPLFFIGAALGNALSGILGAPTDLFAALGFVAIFAGASNTPLACTIMGIELFGATHSVYIATACFISYVCSGHSSIYLSQRVAVPKTSAGNIPLDVPLRQVRQVEPSTLNLLFDQIRFQMFPDPQFSLTPTQGSTTMSQTHQIVPKEVGMVRIYLKPSDRHKTQAKGLRAFFTSRPLYRELVKAAKDDGIINATAHQTHYGFSNHGKVHGLDPEIGNPELTMCVELIGHRSKLETFCRRHGDVLANKVIVYKQLEYWHVQNRDAIPAAEMV